ncbi:FIST signal transduction protein [Rudanella paleaurantiibacter]|uniref:FIST signal transduction protein n=1 Tax=Rudanella paleaurantiibacter TaxID=2614655 RepID=UPI001FE3A22E|nr:FIST N-terminal domain-containing protein [Rudanella paleaurantiibacter]
MRTALVQLSDNTWSRHPVSQPLPDTDVQLFLCFAADEILRSETIYDQVRARFPHAQIALCSTSGEIYHDTVQDDSLVGLAVAFRETTIQTASVNMREFGSSYEAAQALVRQLPTEGLTYLLILSDGSLVNGSELAQGLNVATDNLLITGGLAGDAANFKSTLLGLNTQPATGNIIAIGFYGDKLIVRHGSEGGWDTFGLEKEVTHSESNILHEIDHQNALDLYIKYLGSDADDLPASALLFPLSVLVPGAEQPIVRTILSVDTERKTMTFAGDVPVGSKVRFMKANFDRLTSAASTAARQLSDQLHHHPHFSLLISCVGRKLVLGPHIDEEVEAVSRTLGSNVPLIGFYANGELSPFPDGGACQLHNQTMTITSFYELP